MSDKRGDMRGHKTHPAAPVMMAFLPARRPTMMNYCVSVCLLFYSIQREADAKVKISELAVTKLRLRLRLGFILGRNARGWRQWWPSDAFRNLLYLTWASTVGFW